MLAGRQPADRVAYLTRTKNDFGDACAQRLLKALMSDPASISARAFNNPPSIMSSGNKPEWRRMAQPAANGHGNARSLAGLYTGLLQGRLLDEAVLREMTHEHSAGEDRTLLASTRFGLGCWLDQPDVPMRRSPWGRARSAIQVRVAALASPIRSVNWGSASSPIPRALCADGPESAIAGSLRGRLPALNHSSLQSGRTFQKKDLRPQFRIKLNSGISSSMSVQETRLVHGNFAHEPAEERLPDSLHDRHRRL